VFVEHTVRLHFIEKDGGPFIGEGCVCEAYACVSTL
jgi:hypothetical protein